MKQLCADFFRDLNTKDVQKVSDWFEEDGVIWIPPAGPVASKRKIGVYFRAVFQRYKALNWYVTEIFCISENRCYVLSDSEGVFKDDRPYKNHLVTELRFSDNGKITLLSDYFKDTSCFVAPQKVTA